MPQKIFNPSFLVLKARQLVAFYKFSFLGFGFRVGFQFATSVRTFVLVCDVCGVCLRIGF